MKDYKENRTVFSEEFCRTVYETVKEIPKGKVSTYGAVAALIGFPQYARMVGRALRQVPSGQSVPCHRVVNASGRLAPGWMEQKDLLLEEGVALKPNGCVDLSRFLFKP